MYCHSANVRPTLESHDGNYDVPRKTKNTGILQFKGRLSEGPGPTGSSFIESNMGVLDENGLRSLGFFLSPGVRKKCKIFTMAIFRLVPAASLI